MAIESLTCVGAHGPSSQYVVHFDAPLPTTLGEAMVRAEGWRFVWDCANGLTAVWLCPLCAAQALGLVAALQALVPSIPIKSVNFIPLLPREGLRTPAG